jgi:hypothetical protein
MAGTDTPDTAMDTAATTLRRPITDTLNQRTRTRCRRARFTLVALLSTQLHP